MTSFLLASAPTTERLIMSIAAYFIVSPEEIALLEKGEIEKKGEVVSGWRWTKKGNRYRFEDTDETA